MATDPTDLPLPGSLSPAERRTSPRMLLRAEVTVSSQDNVIVGQTEDVSLGGAFVATLAPPAVGEVVRLELAVEGHARMQIEAEVRWHREGEDGDPVGCGLRFVALDEGARKQLAALLEKLPQQPLYDVEVWDS